ncbi:IS630 family transposase [Glycomyces salinus]|uniref:IS630 family transposase n=1 Tax=Glycomyces salinus TaxID=980294 RepID=UPI001E3FAB31|nr:IS630 family transposase [Glycomyces salinus]
MRRLSPPQQETLRKRVMAAVSDGMTTAEAVRVFGVSRGSIRNWKVRYDTGGAAGLSSGVPGRRLGEQTKLSASEAEALVGSIIDYEPEALDLGGKLWTRRKVRVLAERLFGVSFTEQGMGKLLRRMGFSFQRPDRRAIEAAPEAMREWVEVTYPALRDRARVEGAAILFGDQVGVRSDHLAGRTWGLKGQTPVVARTGNRFGLNAMSTISTRGQLHFTVFRESFNAEVFIAFLDKLLGQFDQKIHLVVDGHSAHRAKIVRQWVERRSKRIELHCLPSYAPHLNPDELVNADLKRYLADQVIIDRDQMERSVRSFFHRVQKLPARVLGYFQAPHTKYARLAAQSVVASEASVTLTRLSFMSTPVGFTCSCCGEHHATLPMGYSTTAPAIWEPSFADAPDCLLSADQCVIKAQHFFVKGLIEIPVLSNDDVFSWGVWVSLSRENFARMVDLWETPGRESTEPYFGWLTTELPVYRPSTINLKTNVHTRPEAPRYV